MRDALILPTGMSIPRELEQAWTWLENQGYGRTASDGSYYLPPYQTDQQLGIVFSPRESLDGWFTPDTSGFDQLLPIAEINTSGSLAALWRCDDGSLKFVALGDDGDKFVLADTPVEFLRLITVGYTDLACFGGEPDEPRAVAALSTFRAWVEVTFDVVVPAQWSVVDRTDEFAAWVDAKLAAESKPQAAPAVDLTGLDLRGDAAVMLAALRTADGGDRIANFLGLPDSSDESLRAAGLYVAWPFYGEVLVSDVTVYFRGSATSSIGSYARADHLIDGLSVTATLAQVKAQFGHPVAETDRSLTYARAGGGQLRFTFDGHGLVTVVFGTASARQLPPR